MITVFSQFFFRNIFLLIVLIIFACSIYSTAAAESRLPTEWKTSIEKSEGLQTLQSTASDDGVEIIRTIVGKNLVGLFKYIFIGIALIFMGMYAYMLSIGTGEEEQMSEQRKNFLFAIVGFTVIGLATKIVEVVDPYKNQAFQQNIIDGKQAESVLQTISTYLEMGLGIIAILIILYGAILMITSNGDEERSGSGKNILLYGFIGIAMVMLAKVLVTTVFYPASAIAGDSIGDKEAKNFIIEGIGLLKFALEFLVIGILVAFVISGFLYLTAGEDDEQAERAKRTLIWTIIGGIVVLTSYGIMTFFTG